MATGPIDPEQRRINLRRARTGGAGYGGGFSTGVSTSSESYNGGEDDEPIDDINAHVRDRADAIPDLPDGGDFRRNLAEVAMAGSPTYAKEHRLALLHRLLMRKVPLNLIAQQLGVSISTVEKDRIALKEQLRESARSLNIDEMIGTQSAFYDDVQAMSLRIASAGPGPNGQGGTPIAMRLAAMRTALAANADRTRFYVSAGVFDVLQFKRGEDGMDISDVQRLMDRTDELLSNLDSLELEEEKPVPRPVIRRTKPRAGFKAMSFDDANASSGDSEVQDL